MIEIILQGRNEHAKAIGKEKSKTYHNYLTSGDPSHSKGYVGLYKEVAISSVYDKIDMRYYFEDNSLRYDYILKPGADVRKIKMQLEGTELSYINELGEWIFETRFGEVKNTKLLSYQTIDGEKKVVPCKFRKDAEGNIVFDLGAYDHTKELVIDPLVYSTFIGSSVPDYGTAIVVDDSNQAFITGHFFAYNVNPLGYPNVGGYYFGFGAWSLIVSKFSSDGSTLQYSTTIANVNAVNMAHDIHLRFDKTIHIVGALHTINNYPAYYGVLTPNGDSLLIDWMINQNSSSTSLRSIKTDSQKNAYFVGDCYAYPEPVFWPPAGVPPYGPWPPISDTFFYFPQFGVDASVLVGKLDSNLNLVGSSVFGASNSSGTSIEVDAAGNIYVVGFIGGGSPFFIYPNSYDSTFNGGYSDAFLAIFNSSCDLLNLSFIGGDSTDKATSVRLDAQGNIYVLGYTDSPDFPITPGCFADSIKGSRDVFIAKFDPSGTNLLYSTYFGGIGKEESTDIQIDSMGNMIFGGFSDSIDLPVTIGCFDDTYNGLGDMFVAKLNGAGDSLLYSTYIGGERAEISYVEFNPPANITSSGSAQCGGLAIDKFGDAYIVGSTDNACLPYPCNNLYPTTLSSYHPLPYYDADIFVSKLKLTPCPVVVAMASANSPLCIGGSLNLSSNMTGGAQPYSYQWFGPNGFTSLMQNVNINNITLADSGIYAVQVTDANGCNSSATVLASINAVPSVIANNDTTLCEGQTLYLTVTPTPSATYNWSGPNGFTSALQNPSIANVTMAATGVFTITVTSANGCTNSDSINVIINPLPTVIANNDTTLCEGQTLDLTVTATPGAAYNWSGPNGFVSVIQNPSIANVSMAANGVYTITVTSANGCTNSDTTSAIINPLPTVIANNDTTLCEGQTLDLTVTATPGATYNWAGPNGFTSALQNPGIANVTMAANGVYTITVSSANGCTNSDTINVIINPLPTVVANNDTTLCQGQTLDLTVTPTAGATYNWSGPNGFTSAFQNPSIANVTMAATGVYTITVTSANGCTSSDTTSVIINLIPTVIANNDTTLCEGQTLGLTVTATPGATYNWAGPNGFTSALQNPSIANVTMAANGVYTITVTSANGCTNSDSINVIINPLPTVIANNDTTLCQGQTLNLTVTATPGATYNWSGPNGFTSALQNPSIANVTMAANGDYTVEVIDSNGCSKSDTTNVKILVCTGIAESTQENTILIFPNPNNGTFTLQTSKLGHYELFDVAGRIINSYTVNSSPYIINEKLASGMYFIRENDKGASIKNRVVQKVIIE